MNIRFSFTPFYILVLILLINSAFSQEKFLNTYQENFKWGLKDTNGTILIKPMYDYLEHAFSNTYIAFESDSSFYYFDTLNITEVYEKQIFNNVDLLKGVNNRSIKENFKIIDVKQIDEDISRYQIICNSKIYIINKYNKKLLTNTYASYKYVSNQDILILNDFKEYFVYKPGKKVFSLGHNYLLFKDIYKNAFFIMNYYGKTETKLCCPRELSISLPYYKNDEFQYYYDTTITEFDDYRYTVGGVFGFFNPEYEKIFNTKYKKLKVIFYDNSYYDNFYIHDISNDSIYTYSKNILDFFLVKSKNGWGVRNSNGGKIIKPKYDAIVPFKRNDSLLFGAVYKNSYELIFDLNGASKRVQPFDLFSSELFHRYDLLFDTAFNISSLNMSNAQFLAVIKKVLSEELKTIKKLNPKQKEVLANIYSKITNGEKIASFFNSIEFNYVIRSIDDRYLNPKISSKSIAFNINKEISDSNKIQKTIFKLSSEDFFELFPLNSFVVEFENELINNLDAIIKKIKEQKRNSKSSLN